MHADSNIIANEQSTKQIMNKTLGDQWHLMPTMGGEPRGDKIPTKSGREGIRKNPNGRDLLRIRELFKSGS